MDSVSVKKNQGPHYIDPIHIKSATLFLHKKLHVEKIDDLFAGKMHAALCRSGKKRIKGRDWYDVIWYIQNGTPVNLVHLRERMRQTKHLGLDEKFGEKELLERIHAKIDEIDWELAKSDIAMFIPDKRKLDIWSAPFFHDLISHLRVVDNIK